MTEISNGNQLVCTERGDLGLVRFAYVEDEWPSTSVTERLEFGDSHVGHVCTATHRRKSTEGLVVDEPCNSGLGSTNRAVLVAPYRERSERGIQHIDE